MSSRKSSRLSNSQLNNIDTTKVNKISQQIFIGVFVLSVIVQCSVLYYLYNLEDANCNCIRDWRHNFCKAYALLVLAVGIIFIALQHLCKGFMILYHIAGLINVYAFFTYIGDLNATQCTCAVNKQTNLNTVMRVLRWVLLLGGIATFMQLLALLGLGSSKIAASSSVSYTHLRAHET